MSFLKPRPYQTECILAFNERFGTGLQRLAAVLPTGMGKTVIFANMVHRFVESTGLRVAVFVHRDELVNQTAQKIHAIDSGITIGVVKAKRHELDADVVIISIQSLSRKDRVRLESIPADHFGLLIVDECHHAAAAGYMAALKWFGAYDPKRNTKVAGFTATLQRQDKLGLGDVFQEVVYKKDILFGIRHRFLVDLRAKSIEVEDLLDDVTTRGGDFTEESLGDAIIETETGKLIAHTYRELAADRTGLVFAPNVASAQQITEDLRDEGFTAEYVIGETPVEERALIYKRCRTGETQILVNNLVLTEGFDMPQISCVVIARPTTNQGLFVQMVGRGLRPWILHDETSEYEWIRTPKRDCLILDVVGASGKNRLASIADLSETTVKEVREDETLSEAIEREEREAEGKKPLDRDKVKVSDVDLFKYSDFSFSQTKNKKYIYIPTKDWLITVYPETTAADTTFMVGTVWCGKGAPRKGRMIGSGMDLGYAMAIAESEAEEIDEVGTIARKNASWKKKKEPASDAQVSYLRTFQAQGKIPADTDVSALTKVEASDLISLVKSTDLLEGYIPQTVSRETEEE